MPWIPIIYQYVTGSKKNLGASIKSTPYSHWGKRNRPRSDNLWGPRRGLGLSATAPKRSSSDYT